MIPGNGDSGPGGTAAADDHSNTDSGGLVQDERPGNVEAAESCKRLRSEVKVLNQLLTNQIEIIQQSWSTSYKKDELFN